MMVRNSYRWSALTCQNIIVPVVLFVEHFASHQSPNLGVIINLLEHVATWVIVVIEGENIESRSSHIFFGSVVVVPSANNPILLELLVNVHFVVAAVFSIEPFLS